MEIKQKAVRGVAWMIAQRSGNQIISFVVIAILTRLLDVDSFGLISMATIYIALMDLFIDQGFLQAIVQRTEISKTYLDTAFWMTLISGSVLTTVNFAASEFVANLFHEPMLSPIVRWLSLSLIFATFSKTHRAILQRKLEFRKLATRTFFAEIFGGVVGVIMAFRGFGVWSLVGRNLTRDFVAMLILWAVSDWRPRLMFSWVRLRELYSFGVNVVGSQFLIYISRYADRFLIGFLLDATVLGFYTVAIRLIELLSAMFLQSIELVSFPIFSKLQNEMDRMRNAFYQLTWYTSILAIPCFLGILIIAPEIVLTIFGSKWAASIPILRILSLAGIAQVVHLYGWSLLIACGKPSWHLGLTALNTLGIINAVAAGIVISTYAIIPLTLWAIRSAVKVRILKYFRQFHPALLSSLVMFIFILILKTLLRGLVSGGIGLVIYIVCALLIYGLILWRLQPEVLKKVRELIYLLTEDQLMPTSESSY
jgi:O-antigen/teichoic acid export membrane protein